VFSLNVKVMLFIIPEIGYVQGETTPNPRLFARPTRFSYEAVSINCGVLHGKEEARGEVLVLQ
jgi:hypothetical protein